MVVRVERDQHNQLIYKEILHILTQGVRESYPGAKAELIRNEKGEIEVKFYIFKPGKIKYFPIAHKDAERVIDKIYCHLGNKQPTYIFSGKVYKYRTHVRIRDVVKNEEYVKKKGKYIVVFYFFPQEIGKEKKQREEKIKLTFILPYNSLDNRVKENKVKSIN